MLGWLVGCWVGWWDVGRVSGMLGGLVGCGCMVGCWVCWWGVKWVGGMLGGLVGC